MQKKKLSRAEKRFGYVDDYSKDAQIVGQSALRGPPPANHPRQCHSRSKASGSRCRRWALKGSEYCQIHGGRRSVVNPRIEDKLMAGFYSKRLSKKFRDRLAEIGDDEVFSLEGEVRISKDLCCEALALYDSIVVNDSLSGKPNRDAMQSLAHQALRNAVEHVTKISESAAKVDTLRKDRIPAVNIELIAAQVTKICMTNLKEHPELLQKMLKDIEDIKILETSDTKVVLSIL